MKKSSNTPRLISSFALIPALVAFSPIIHATGCKGLSDTQCRADPQCRWIKGYTRADGRQVNGYCRMDAAKKRLIKMDQPPPEEDKTVTEAKPQG